MIISKLMTSQSGQQIITIHILPNISRSNENETWSVNRKQRENIFFKNNADNQLGRLVPDLFLFIKIALYKVKTSDQHVSFNIPWQTSTWAQSKNKLYNNSDC